MRVPLTPKEILALTPGALEFLGRDTHHNEFQVYLFVSSSGIELDIREDGLYQTHALSLNGLGLKYGVRLVMRVLKDLKIELYPLE